MVTTRNIEPRVLAETLRTTVLEVIQEANAPVNAALTTIQNQCEYTNGSNSSFDDVPNPLEWHKQFHKIHGENVLWLVYEKEKTARFNSVFEDHMEATLALTKTKHVSQYASQRFNSGTYANRYTSHVDPANSNVIKPLLPLPSPSIENAISVDENEQVEEVSDNEEIREDNQAPMYTESFPHISLHAFSGVMDAPTLPVSAKKNLGDPIDIRVDIVHPTPTDVFPAATVVKTLAQHGEDIRGIHGMGMVEEENASLRGSIKTMEAIDTITRRQEKRARMELKRQLTSVDKYISGLPDNIHGNVMAARAKTLDDAIELANDLMDQKLRTYAERQTENKRKLDNNNQAQQQLLKKQNVVQAYAVGTGEKKSYGGSKPLCPKCNYHHDGECAPKCTNCKKIGHLTKDCWHPINANNQRTITCYECRNQGHYRSDCPVLKNQGTEARGMVYALGGGETNQDLDNTKDDINA
nr:hypothetical protein [Tanacetum cinerariifolium]